MSLKFCFCIIILTERVEQKGDFDPSLFFLAQSDETAALKRHLERVEHKRLMIGISGEFINFFTQWTFTKGLL